MQAIPSQSVKRRAEPCHRLGHTSSAGKGEETHPTSAARHSRRLTKSAGDNRPGEPQCGRRRLSVAQSTKAKTLLERAAPQSLYIRRTQAELRVGWRAIRQSIRRELDCVVEKGELRRHNITVQHSLSIRDARDP